MLQGGAGQGFPGDKMRGADRVSASEGEHACCRGDGANLIRFPCAARDAAGGKRRRRCSTAELKGNEHEHEGITLEAVRSDWSWRYSSELRDSSKHIAYIDVLFSARHMLSATLYRQTTVS